MNCLGHNKSFLLTCFVEMNLSPQFYLVYQIFVSVIRLHREDHSDFML